MKTPTFLDGIQLGLELAILWHEGQAERLNAVKSPRKALNQRTAMHQISAANLEVLRCEVLGITKTRVERG